MAIQQMLFGGGSPPPTDLASLAGIASNAVTDVRVTPLAKKYCYSYYLPANGYQGVPGTNANGDGFFMTAMGKCDEDNRGMWKNCNGSTIPYPTGLTAIDSVPSASSGNWYGGGTYGNPYNATNVTSFGSSHANDGGFLNGGVDMYADNNNVFHYVTGRFNSGLGSAKGIVIQYFGNYVHLAYHHTPVLRITINPGVQNVSRTYMPKGIYTYSNTTTVNTTQGNMGVVYYPSKYDWTSVSDLDTFFNGQTQTTLSNAYFEY